EAEPGPSVEAEATSVLRPYDQQLRACFALDPSSGLLRMANEVSIDHETLVLDGRADVRCLRTGVLAIVERDVLFPADRRLLERPTDVVPVLTMPQRHVPSADGVDDASWEEHRH